MNSQQANAAPVLNKSVPVRHPGRWLSAVIILGFLAVFLQSLVTNRNFRWDIVGTYILDVKVVQGVGWTLLLTVASMVLAIVLAILLAFMRQSDNPVFRWSSWVWVWFFRGTPVYASTIRAFRSARSTGISLRTMPASVRWMALTPPYIAG